MSCVILTVIYDTLSTVVHLIKTYNFQSLTNNANAFAGIPGQQAQPGQQGAGSSLGSAIGAGVGFLAGGLFGSLLSTPVAYGYPAYYYPRSYYYPYYYYYG